MLLGHNRLLKSFLRKQIFFEADAEYYHRKVSICTMPNSLARYPLFLKLKTEKFYYDTVAASWNLYNKYFLNFLIQKNL